jgi:hypothetical protein
VDLETVADAVAEAGLICRGGFHLRVEDGVDPAAGTLVLIGNAGPAMWRVFRRQVSERDRRRRLHPLDAWTRRILTDVALRLGARPLFPFEGPPFHPFSTWSMRCEPVCTSPIGPLVHPDYGLWHAYRGALVFTRRLPLPPADDRPCPCEACVDKPCLGGCPVRAIGTGFYDVPGCVRHLRSGAGGDCLTRGCRARRACPLGQDHRYDPDQAEFHMRRFVADRLASAAIAPPETS